LARVVYNDAAKGRVDESTRKISNEIRRRVAAGRFRSVYDEFIVINAIEWRVIKTAS